MTFSKYIHTQLLLKEFLQSQTHSRTFFKSLFHTYNELQSKRVYLILESLHIIYMNLCDVNKLKPSMAIVPLLHHIHSQLGVLDKDHLLDVWVVMQLFLPNLFSFFRNYCLFSKNLMNFFLLQQHLIV